jgi:RNA polymerase sigma factor (sigma-70 family)
MANEAAKKRLDELLPKLKKAPQDGDLWEELYANTRPFVYSIAFRSLRGVKALAEEATQQTFLRVFRYCDFKEFSDAEEFLAYLSTISRHCAIDTGKKEAPHSPTALDLLACDFLPSQPNPEQRQRAREELQNVLDHLGGDDSRLVHLLMAGLSLTEVAKRLGVTYPAAAVRIHRLRLKLLNRLKRKGLND